MPNRRRAGSRRSETSAPATPSQQTKPFSTLLRDLENGIQDADLPQRGCSFAAGQLEGLTHILIDMAGKDRFDADTVTSAWMAPGARSALLQLCSVLLRAPVQRPNSQPDSFSHSYPLHLATKMLLLTISQDHMQDREAFLAHVLAPALAAQMLPAAGAFVAHCTRCAAAEPPGPKSYYRRDIEAIGLPCVNSMVVLAGLEPRLQLPCNLGMAGPAILSVLADSHALEHVSQAACRVATPRTVLFMGNILHYLTMILKELRLLDRGMYDCTAAAVLNSGVLHRIGSGPCLQYYLALYTLSQLRGGPRPGGPLYGLQAEALLPVPTGGGDQGAGEDDGGEAETDDTWLRDTLSLWTFFHSRLGVLKDGVVSLLGLFRLCLEVAETGVEGLRRTVGDGASGAGDRAGGQGGGGGGGASGGSEAGAAAGWWPSPVAAIHAVMFAGLLLDSAPCSMVQSIQHQEAEACEGLVSAPSGGRGSAAVPEAVDRLLFGNSSSQSSSSGNSSSTAAAGTPASCDGGNGGQAGGRAPGVRASTGRLRAWWRATVGVVQACLDSGGLAPHAMADLLSLQLHGEPAAPGSAALPHAPPRNLAAALSAGYVPCLERFLRQAQRACDTPQRAEFLLTLVQKGVHLPHLMSYGNVRQVAALVATVGKLLARPNMQPAVASSSDGVGAEAPQCADWLQAFPSLSQMTAAALEGTGAASTAFGSGGAAGASSGSSGGSSVARSSDSGSGSGGNACCRASSTGSAGSTALTAGEATGTAGTTQATAADGGSRFRALTSLALARWLPVLAAVGATPSPPQPPTSGPSQATTSYLLRRTASLTAIHVVFNLLPILVSAYQCSVARGDAAAAASWRGLLLHDLDLPRRLGPLLWQLEAARADGLPIHTGNLSRVAAALEVLLSVFPEMLQGVLAADAKLIGLLRRLFGPFGALPNTELLLGLEELAVAGTWAHGASGGLARAGAAASPAQAGGGSSDEHIASTLVPPCRLTEALALPLCANPQCRSLEGGSEADLKLSKCSRCRAVAYCCRECQAEHWGKGGHSSVCDGAGAALA